jgi:hypothetical protein
MSATAGTELLGHAGNKTSKPPKLNFLGVSYLTTTDLARHRHDHEELARV